MRCVVLRPRDQARATAARLGALGHTALVAPIMTIVPTGDPAPDGIFAGVVLTSANALPGLRSFAGRMAAPIWVVGARTAEALARDGFNDVVWAANAAALAGLIAASALPGRLLLIGGHDRKPEPAATLRAAGFELVLWDSYRAAIADALPTPLDAALREGSLDAALHYSRRSAAAALTLADAAGLAGPFAALLHICLSPDVAAALTAIPPDRVTVAGHPDEDSLLALVPPPVPPSAWVGSRRA
jgi:uroporphyrinogen-III synthase